MKKPAVLALLLCLALPSVVRAEEADLTVRIDAAMQAADYAAALPLTEKHLATLEAAGAGPAALAPVRHVLGSLTDRLGNHAEALAMLTRAHAEYTAAGAPVETLAACADEAGQAAQGAGDREVAERWLRGAIAGRAGDPALAAASRVNLGNVFLSAGQVAAAEGEFRTALTDSAGAGDVRCLAERGLGVAAHTSGAWAEALEHFHAARALAAGLPDREELVAALDGQIGQTLLRAGRTAQAESLLEGVAQRFAGRPDRQEDLAAALNNLAALWLSTGRPEAARDRLAPLLTDGGAFADGPLAITPWLNLAAAQHRLGALPAASGALSAARRLAAAFLPDVHPLRAQISLAACALARDQQDPAGAFREAREHARVAIAWLEEAAAWPDESRLREFRRTLDPLSPLAACAGPDAGSTVALADVVLTCQGAVQDLLLARRKPGTAHLRHRTAESVSTALPERAVLVDFVWWRPCGDGGQWDPEGRYGALVLRRGAGPQWIDLGPAGPVDARIRRIITAARDTVAADAEAANRASLLYQLGNLRELLWAPLAAHATGAETVFLRADGMLHFVPWAILHNAAESKEAFFCQEYPDVRLVTAASAGPPRPLRSGRWKVIAVTDSPAAGMPPRPARLPPPLTPALWEDLSSMPALPGVRREVEAIRAAAGREVTVLTPPPLEASLTDSVQPDVLHLAGHGFAAEDEDWAGSPLLRAGMVLGECSAGLRALTAGSPLPAAADGLLFTADAAALPLEHTGLVVLSGCQTGLGHWQAGEHFTGLRHSFLSAGAGAVASTLWDLNDARAPEMVRRIYLRLAAGDAPARAVWQAQREWMEDPATQDLKPGLRAALAGCWLVETAGWPRAGD